VTLLQIGQATTDNEFRLRVKAALFTLAQDVIYEDAGTPNHVFRIQLAQRVAQNPDSVVDLFVWLCAANPSIASSVSVEGSDVQVTAPDGDVQFVCASNWDIVSGYSARI
jgi:hypothetical protein